jgi:hypothetical protein
MRRRASTITITSTAHDASEALGGVSLGLALAWVGVPWWVAGLAASPVLPLLFFARHRVRATPEETLWHHVRDGIWEVLLCAAAWPLLAARGQPGWAIVGLGAMLVLYHFADRLELGSP